MPWTKIYPYDAHKDYKCASCANLFSTRQSLKNHIHTVHEGHKDHKCTSCGKSFSDQGYLKKHILIYNSQRPQRLQM